MKENLKCLICILILCLLCCFLLSGCVDKDTSETTQITEPFTETLPSAESVDISAHETAVPNDTEEITASTEATVPAPVTHPTESIPTKPYTTETAPPFTEPYIPAIIPGIDQTPPEDL